LLLCEEIDSAFQTSCSNRDLMTDTYITGGCQPYRRNDLRRLCKYCERRCRSAALGNIVRHIGETMRETALSGFLLGDNVGAFCVQRPRKTLGFETPMGKVPSKCWGDRLNEGLFSDMYRQLLYV